MAVGIDADGIPHFAAQQLVNRAAVELADEIVERGLDAGDGVPDDAGRRTRGARLPRQMLDQAVDLARIPSDQQRRQLSQDRRQTRREEALARAVQAVAIRLDPDKGVVVVGLNNGRREARDLHGDSSLRKSNVIRKSSQPVRMCQSFPAARWLATAR